MKKRKRKYKKPIPVETTPLTLCKKCGEYVRVKYSLGKKVRYKIFNENYSTHHCENKL